MTRRVIHALCLVAMLFGPHTREVASGEGDAPPYKPVKFNVYYVPPEIPEEFFTGGVLVDVMVVWIAGAHAVTNEHARLIACRWSDGGAVVLDDETGTLRAGHSTTDCTQNWMNAVQGFPAVMQDSGDLVHQISTLRVYVRQQNSYRRYSVPCQQPVVGGLAPCLAGCRPWLDAIEDLACEVSLHPGPFDGFLDCSRMCKVRNERDSIPMGRWLPWPVAP